MVEMIQEWRKELEDLHGRIAHHFARPEPRRRALSYLKGLTGALERKNGAASGASRRGYARRHTEAPERRRLGCRTSTRRP